MPIAIYTILYNFYLNFYGNDHLIIRFISNDYFFYIWLFFSSSLFDLHGQNLIPGEIRFLGISRANTSPKGGEISRFRDFEGKAFP